MQEKNNEGEQKIYEGKKSYVRAPAAMSFLSRLKSQGLASNQVEDISGRGHQDAS